MISLTPCRLVNLSFALRTIIRRYTEEICYKLQLIQTILLMLYQDLPHLHTTECITSHSFLPCSLPVLEGSEESDDRSTSGMGAAAVLSRFPRWFTLGHIEAQQCDLAAHMLSACKGE